MKIVIHAGMHKTGSSSIQHNFSKSLDPKLHYAKWRSPNHSGMFALLFGPIQNTLNYHTFRKRGLSLSEAEAERATWRAALEKDISSATGKTFLFSAEVFSTPNNKARIEDAAQFFRSNGDVRIIAYVRPPISFMQSAMQQRLKGGSKISDLTGLYPRYRERFEIIDNLFGHENVELIKYDRKSLHEEDVVVDFGSRLGITISKDVIEQRNESLSLEAAGALYVQRNMGSGHPEGYPQATVANRKFVNSMRGLGSTKIVFSEEMVKPVLNSFKHDIDWIENRINQSILDLPSTKPTFTSFDDLISGAISIIPEIERKLGVSSQGKYSLDYAVALIERLKEKCEAAARSQPAS